MALLIVTGPLHKFFGFRSDDKTRAQVGLLQGKVRLKLWPLTEWGFSAQLYSEGADLFS